MWLRAMIALGFLLAFAALSNADTQATTHAAYDQSTPQAAYASLLQAIHREDLNGVGNFILECVDLDAADRQRDADPWLKTQECRRRAIGVTAGSYSRHPNAFLV